MFKLTKILFYTGVEQDFSEDVIEQFKADVDLKAFQLYIVERNCDLSLLYPALSVFLIYVDDNKIDWYWPVFENQ